MMRIIGIAHCTSPIPAGLSSFSSFSNIDFKTLMQVDSDQINSDQFANAVFKNSLRHNITHTLRNFDDRLNTYSIKMPEGIVTFEDPSRPPWRSPYQCHISNFNFNTKTETGGRYTSKCFFELYDLSCNECQEEELSGGEKRVCENCAGTYVNPELLDRFEKLCRSDAEPSSFSPFSQSRNSLVDLEHLGCISCTWNIKRYIGVANRLSHKFSKKSYRERRQYGKSFPKWIEKNYDDWIKKRG